MASSSHQDSTLSETGMLKQELFARVSDLQGIKAQLQKLQLLPPQKRQVWIDENEAVLQEMLENLLSDSLIVVESFDQDKDTLNLATEYVNFLREVVYQMRGLLTDTNSLVS